jgi:sugar phosphate isomerase/epimerase
MGVRLAWRLSPQVYAWRMKATSEAKSGEPPAFLLAGMGDAAAAGYDGIEVGLSVLGSRVERIAELLAEHRLALAALFATLRLESCEEAMREIPRLAAAAGATGCRLLNLATLADPRLGAAAADPPNLVPLLSELGARVSEQGMRLCWHPHEEHLRADGARLLALLEATPAQHVHVCLDLGWVGRAGTDPVRLLRACGSRLGTVHLRDVRGGVWCQALGEGGLDLDGICAELRGQEQVEWASVELWFERATPVTRSLLANARASADALRRPQRLGAPPGGSDPHIRPPDRGRVQPGSP